MCAFNIRSNHCGIFCGNLDPDKPVILLLNATLNCSVRIGIPVFLKINFSPDVLDSNLVFNKALG